MLLLIACSEDPDFYGDTDSDTDTDSEVDCETIDCDDPPNAECTEDGNLIQYTGESTCIEGECYYTQITTECIAGCTSIPGEDDECTNPCEGVICNDPPEPTCASDYSLQYYEEIGACHVWPNGETYCSYASNEIEDCKLGCVQENNVGHCEAGDTDSYHPDCYCSGDELWCPPPEDLTAICDLVDKTCYQDSGGAWCE